MGGGFRNVFASVFSAIDSRPVSPAGTLSISMTGSQVRFVPPASPSSYLEGLDALDCMVPALRPLLLAVAEGVCAVMFADAVKAGKQRWLSSPPPTDLLIVAVHEALDSRIGGQDVVT
jgi:hypothetical protein